MNTSLTQSDGRTTAGTDAEQQIEADAVLSALDDPDCRCILATVASSPSTASELVDRCDLPSSTAYRKLDLLTEAELLEERTRLRTDGNHVSEYACNVSAVTLEVSADGVSLSVDVGEDVETDREGLEPMARPESSMTVSDD